MKSIKKIVVIFFALLLQVPSVLKAQIQQPTARPAHPPQQKRILPRIRQVHLHLSMQEMARFWCVPTTKEYVLLR